MWPKSSPQRREQETVVVNPPEIQFSAGHSGEETGGSCPVLAVANKEAHQGASSEG